MSSQEQEVRKRHNAREFLRLLVEDDVFQARFKKRVLDELEGEYGASMPAVELTMRYGLEADPLGPGEFRVVFTARRFGPRGRGPRPGAAPRARAACGERPERSRR